MTLMLRSFRTICDVRHLLTILAAVLFLTGAQRIACADSVSEGSILTATSAQLVAGFFRNTMDIVFLTQTSDSLPAQTAALRQVLARSINAGGIGHFILGRYARLSQPIRDPGEDFLDFAARQIMRMAPVKKDVDGATIRPALAISGITNRSDQTQLVMSELVWPNGKRLPLAWEVSGSSEATRRIEDVSCLGISLRLMLRSAVAEAAAEHPENSASLASLLAAGPSLGHLPTSPTQAPADGQ